MTESVLDGRVSYITPHPVRGGEYVISNRMFPISKPTNHLIQTTMRINRLIYNIDEGMESCGEVEDRWIDGSGHEASLADEARTCMARYRWNDHIDGSFEG